MRQTIALLCVVVAAVAAGVVAVGAQQPPPTRPRPPVAKPTRAPPPAATASRRALPDGARIYATTCVACHQASGQGLPNQFPPLVGSDWVTGSDERLIRIILHGVIGEIEVEGETFTGAMPTWGPTFKDDELAAVASYVRRSWGNKAPEVSTATVTRVRVQFASRNRPWTSAELLKSGTAAKPH